MFYVYIFFKTFTDIDTGVSVTQKLCEKFLMTSAAASNISITINGILVVGLRFVILTYPCEFN